MENIKENTKLVDLTIQQLKSLDLKGRRIVGIGEVNLRLLYLILDNQFITCIDYTWTISDLNKVIEGNSVDKIIQYPNELTKAKKDRFVFELIDCTNLEDGKSCGLFSYEEKAIAHLETLKTKYKRIFHRKCVLKVVRRELDEDFLTQEDEVICV